jgi:preprotein translocase subunit SecB
MSPTATNNPDAGNKPAFQLGQVFLQRCAFQHRREPLALPPDTKLEPQEINIQLGFANLNNGEAARVMVLVTTNPEDGDEKALYDFMVEMVAIVHNIDHEAFPDRQLAEVVAAMIYPFAREAVANLTTRGRFGPVWLNPINIRTVMRNMFAAQEASGAASKKENPTP